jgi:hypothetical protein
MTNLKVDRVAAELRSAWERLHLYARAVLLRATHFTRRDAFPSHVHPDLLYAPQRWRKWLFVAGGVIAVLATACGGLAWRLASGPLPLDLATPWLTSALQERLGPDRRLEVGGTQLERDGDGRTALRLRDIVLRDATGNVVASAPKAEVGIATGSLLTGHVRAERLSLIGAAMGVRIERDGALTVFAGSHSRPLATAPPAPARPEPGAPAAARAGDAVPAKTAGPAAAAEPGETTLLSALLGWIQGLDAVGLDGRDLIEIGLRNGSIAVDDQRNGKQLNFPNIDLSLTRPKEGGAALAVTSMGTDGPWSLNATITPRGEGRRLVDAVVRDVSPKDILLALRLDVGNLQADVPVSAAMRAEIDRDGTPQTLEGRVLAGAGHIGNIDDPASRILIDEAQMELRWDAANRQLAVPIDIHMGQNRISLMGQIGFPRERGGNWSIGVSQGLVMLASLERTRASPLVLDRVSLRASFDPGRRRLTLEQGDLRGIPGGVALSGAVDFSGDEPRLNFGIAGTRMTVPAMKRLWPAFIVPPVRAWVEDHVHTGTIERLDIAGNARWSEFRPEGPPLPDDGLSVLIEAQGAAIQPVAGLPVIRDADILARVNGRSATVAIGRGSVELPSGRKLTLTNGAFEVPNTKLREPLARTRFRAEGPVEAAVELIMMDALRDSAAIPFEPSDTRGAFAAQVSVAHPLKKDLTKEAVQYTVDAELTGFVADKFLRGQKAEAAMLRVSANQNVLQLKGDMKIAGTPAVVEFRRARGEPDAEVRLAATLDDAARARMGLDAGPALTGPVPVKINGRTKMADRESRLVVEADLTQAKVTDLLPGWVKAAGRPARASFVLADKGQTMRLEDFSIGGSGAAVKGNLELDADGQVLHAVFPSFVLSDGDKASLTADRGSDGTLKVVLRGDVYDGRGFVKGAVAGQKPDQRAKASGTDLDLEIKLGAVTGHHGEALRALDLKLSRRAGQIRTLSLAGKLGQDATLSGDLRARGGKQVVYLETNDAGALFRFTDTYARIFGGSASIAIDPPSLDNAPQEGLLNIYEFAVRGEPALESVASNNGVDPNDRTQTRRPAAAASGVAFSHMRVEFTKSPGRMAMHDGVVWGPAVGATVEGHVDYARDEVRLRGTFVPAYALNNMFARIPIVGLFLGGGSNEGLLGITYQVIGSPKAPMLQVNPMSVVAPGFLRKLMEFRGGEAGPVAGAAGDERGFRPPEPVR